MSKINLRLKLKSEEENLDLNIKGIKNNNKVIYKENNVNVTLIINKNTIEMNRSCNEYNINLVFEKDKTTMSTYKVFGASKEFLLETKTNKLQISNKKITIDYDLEGNIFNFSLDMEEE